MALSRKELIAEFDAALERWYPENVYGDDIPTDFGSFEVKFQNGASVIIVGQRETRKPMNPISGAEVKGYK